MRSLSRSNARRLASAAVWLLLIPVMGANVDRKPEWRTFDGSDNNSVDPKRGKAGMPLMRTAGHAYEDGVAEPSGSRRPSARVVSNEVAEQTEEAYAANGASDYVWLWGQFLDHDIDLTPGHDPAEPMDIEVPAGDPWFDPTGTGTQTIPLSRSTYDPKSGKRRSNPRRQLNMITSWIDASNVYGSDKKRARALRRGRGDGLLKNSPGNLLPYNRRGLDNAGGPDPSLFLAGDVRANEQVSLTAMHTLWMREHNRIARQLRADHPGMSGDEIYQRARSWVGALLQVITYNEFLPVILGDDAFPAYDDWNPWIDGSVSNEFSTAAYRFGHSMVSAQLLRIDRYGDEIPEGHLALRDSFFTPIPIETAGIDPVLRGLAAQRAREVDTMVVDELRNFLFGPPGSGGFDLASLNIQRGRDHGLECYNQTRLMYGLSPHAQFDDITPDAEMAATLEELYADIEEIDLWVGGLAEPHVPGSMLGETFYQIVRDQFLRLRDGDRFFYKRVYRGNDLYELESTKLSDVIRRNTHIGYEIPDDVFYVR